MDKLKVRNTCNKIAKWFKDHKNEIAPRLMADTSKPIPIKSEKLRYVYPDAVKFIREKTNKKYSVSEILDILEGEELYMTSVGIMDGTFIKEDYDNDFDSYKED